jgi:NAD(P)-dependent dehydrogenase (short-subunit alcohol dehydrogenase family)
MGHLEGKAIVVTGGGRALGRAYALDAASEGACVVVNDVDAEVAYAVADEIRGRGGETIAVVASVSDWDAAAGLVRQCRDAFGQIDGLVNNAGIFHSSAPWDETEDRVRRIVEVNVLGAMFCGIHAFAAMREQGHGSIVNVTSGAHLGLIDISTYGATKGAVASMTYGWALHAREVGLRVNAVSPTAFSRMTKDWTHHEDIPSNPDPEVIAPLVSYLLSDRAAAINGQIVRLDGRALSLLVKARYSDARVEREAWDFDVIGEAFDRGTLGELAPIGMDHPANVAGS